MTLAEKIRQEGRISLWGGVGDREGRYLGANTLVIYFGLYHIPNRLLSPGFELCWWEFKYCCKGRL